MIIKKVEHLTRYTLFHDEQEFLRINEKDVEGNDKNTWLVKSEESAYIMLDEESHNELEILFLQQIE